MQKLLPQDSLQLTGYSLQNKWTRLKKSVPCPLSPVNSFGFTLVELLVTISIIAILAVTGAVFYNGVQGSSRDARRKGEIEAISKAMESRYIVNTGTTCDQDPYAGQAVTTNNGDTYCPLQNEWFERQVVPTDPIGGGVDKYCMWITVNNTPIAAPAVANAWGNGACPTLSGVASFIPADGQPSVSTRNITNFRVCAQLETTPVSFFCKANQL